MTPDRFWDQTPRINRIVLLGTVRAEQRRYERMALGARWVGALAQIHPKHHPSVDKLMGRNKPVSAMTPEQIDSAMQAWAGATRRQYGEQ